MATNQTNIVNINNMPEAQQIFDGNYLIVQNNNGTQIIDWVNVDVIKLGVNGGGSYTGILSGDGLQVGSITTGSVSGSVFQSDGQTGVTLAGDFYNKFITTNGLTTSGTYVLGSPEYLDIVGTRIPAATAALVSAYPAIYEDYIDSDWQGAQTFYTFTFSNQLPRGLASSDIRGSDFNLIQNDTNAPVLSAGYSVGDITTTTSGALKATVRTNQTNLDGVPFSLKVMKTYTAV